ncbi:MAG: RluA family pseudouridine synthase [Planctomyces sp.]|nr:RluA family pseudouridine synthase [Planctomyces sp.]
MKFTTTTETAGAVLSVLRKHAGELSWSAARKFLEGRRIAVNGILCIDEGRRLVEGDVIEVREHPLPPPPSDDDVRILYCDEHVVVVDKPPGMLSLRHPDDVQWRRERKERQPSLEESLSRLLENRERRIRPRRSRELLAVHRIDRETSGILVFARTLPAQEGLIQQFAAHSALRRYLCVLHGWLPQQTLTSWQVRDRGDRLRGGIDEPGKGLLMVTHVSPLRRLGDFTEMECRLETGRTNQIRIQLAELGHPICGDVKYRGKFGEPPIPDDSRAPRLALHATELGFDHPITREPLKFELPWPTDMLKFIRQVSTRPAAANKPAP